MRKFIYILMILIVAWMFWATHDRTHELKPPDIHLDHTETLITDSTCSRNIVGIQPFMFPEDYLSEGHFYEKLKAYFDEANTRGYFKENTVVLLPEYLGTWLVISGEKLSVAEIGHIKEAMAIMVLSNPRKFTQAIINNQKEEDVFGAALFRMKATEMARIYSEVFEELATSYRVTIVAGSIILPAPSVKDNQIEVNSSGQLFNSSFIFNSNGTIEPAIVKKSYPITSELPFVASCPIDQLPVFELPIGKTAILVCADSWYPESYNQIDELSAEIVLVSSFSTGNNIMDSKWKGYDGNDEPSDVNREDIGVLTERDAWIKYAMPGRITNTKAKIGVTVFLRGNLWDLGSDGQPLFVKDNQLIKVAESEHAGIWNFCF